MSEKRNFDDVVIRRFLRYAGWYALGSLLLLGGLLATGPAPVSDLCWQALGGVILAGSFAVAARRNSFTAVMLIQMMVNVIYVQLITHVFPGRAFMERLQGICAGIVGFTVIAFLLQKLLRRYLYRDQAAAV